MIDVVDTKPEPHKLTSRKDTYMDIRGSLVSGLAELDAQKELALSSVI
jgi:hypothetical protein